MTMDFFKDMRLFLGTLVLLISILVFIFLSYNFAFLRKTDCYEVSGLFDDVSGLVIGSEVLVSGVKIGEVIGISLRDFLKVEVKMCIDRTIHFPSDSMALVSAKNILSGRKAIDIDLGSDDKNLLPGESFHTTRSALDLEQALRLLVARGLSKKGR